MAKAKKQPNRLRKTRAVTIDDKLVERAMRMAKRKNPTTNLSRLIDTLLMDYAEREGRT